MITNKGLMVLTRLGLIWFWLIPFYPGLSGCDRDNPPPDDQETFVRLRRDQSFKSRVLNRAIKYAVLFPEGYETSKDRFPVVYLLHGMGDDETAWCNGGSFAWYADRYAAETGPSIYIMPEGFNSYWVNRYNGRFPYMDMLITEMIPLVDSLFRTLSDARHRAVMGYSMGGYGALVLPAKNPDVFQTGVVLSMSFRTDQQYMDEIQSVFDNQWGSVFGGIGTSGTARLTDYYISYSPFHFFNNPDDASLSGQNYYLDCGDDEENLSEPNDALHVLLRDLNIRHEYRVRNGAHNWDYWHQSLPEALSYIGHAFKAIPYPDEPDRPETGPAVAAGRIVEGQPEGGDMRFRLVLPVQYATDTMRYPVIVVLHDRDSLDGEEQTARLFSELNNLMVSKMVPISLVVEIPACGQTISGNEVLSMMNYIRTNYRTRVAGKFAVLLGNGYGGKLAYELLPEYGDLFNACLFFNGSLPDDATAGTSGLSYYLDICDNSRNFTGYHSLFMDLRKKKISCEYRVRQGVGTHDSFIAGLGESASFMKIHLKY